MVQELNIPTTCDETIIKNFEAVKEVIGGIRTIRLQKNIAQKEIFMSPQTKSGYLIVRASTASGAIPVEGVTVIVQGKDEENSNVFLTLTTNSDGLTEKVTLPTVSSSTSLSPSENVKPYSLYNIVVMNLRT